MDELDQCNDMVGKDDHRFSASRYDNGSRNSSLVKEGYKPRQYFPFKQGNLFVGTLRVGAEGIQMTVDGKHITSFGYREVGPFFPTCYELHLNFIGNYELIFVFFIDVNTFRAWSHGLLVK